MLKKSFWKNYFDVYDYLNLLIPYQDLLRQIVAEANIRPGDYVLDAGSGTGNLSVLLNNQRAIITAIDYSEDGHRLHVSKKTGANIIKTDLTDRLPFPDNYFDRICSNNTIYTIASEKRLQIFKEFLRVLKPGGVIVVSNVIQKFDPFKIYFDHLDQDIKKSGIFRALSNMVRLIIPTVRLLYYNYVIKHEEGIENQRFMSDEEQKNLLLDGGFKNISDNLYVYSNQAILNKASK